MKAHRLALLTIACVCGLICAGCGPRMRVQPSLQPYERRMPQMADNAVPTNGRLQTLTEQQSQLARNPLPRNRTNLRNGEIYYRYYCLMCHGQDGSGEGPVGNSYVPKPADLTSPEIAAMTDGQLYRAMLYGVGHDPVLEQTVLPEHRWPIVMHVRGMSERGEHAPPPRR